MPFAEYVIHMHLKPKRESALEIWLVVEAIEIGINIKVECLDNE